MSVSWLDVLQETKDTAPPPKPPPEADSPPASPSTSPKGNAPVQKTHKKKSAFFSCYSAPSEEPDEDELAQRRAVSSPTSTAATAPPAAAHAPPAASPAPPLSSPPVAAPVSTSAAPLSTSPAATHPPSGEPQRAASSVSPRPQPQPPGVAPRPEPTISVTPAPAATMPAPAPTLAVPVAPHSTSSSVSSGGSPHNRLLADVNEYSPMPPPSPGKRQSPKGLPPTPAGP